MLLSKSALAVAAAALASATFQVIVFDYTKANAVHTFSDWHRLLILIVSGLGLALGALETFRYLKASMPYEAMHGILLMAPALILFTYVLHSQWSPNKRIAEFSREFSHLYSGLTLVLMIVAGLLAVPALVQHAMHKR